jgi:lipopolysaccharide export system protein LptA
MTASRALQRLPATALMLALLVLSMRLPALEEDQEQPLYLEADSAELDEAKSLSIYTGNVFIRQGSMHLWGDHVTVHHDPKRRPEHIVAVGVPAKYQQQVEGEEQVVKAEALRMEYDAAKDEITLIDKAVLFQGADRFSSDRIVYDRTQGQVKAGASAQGTERVQITITPSNR